MALTAVVIPTWQMRTLRQRRGHSDSMWREGTRPCIRATILSRGGGQTAEFPWAHPGLLLNLHSALRGDKDWHPGLEVGELEPGKDLARLTQLVNGQSSSLTHN